MRTPFVRQAYGSACSVVFVALFLTQALLGQNLEVIRNVNLRPAPSKNNQPIQLVLPPAVLELLELTQKNGYFHVKIIVGEAVEEGWVWARNVRPVPSGDDTEEMIQPEVPLGPAVSEHISSSWAKGTLKKTTFRGADGRLCAFDGNGSDPVQFTLKNRSDTPTAYHEVTWAAVDELDFPGKADQQYAPMHRKDWNPSQLAVIEAFEGIPVSVVGYVVAIKPQNGGSGEGTNCNFNKVGDTDTHIALVEHPGDGEATSIVIEWTPRFLKAHPNWTKSKLLPWLDSDKPVRVSGWLMVDPDHFPHLGRFRNTLWEIHPITKVEVFQNGRFVDIDQLP